MEAILGKRSAKPCRTPRETRLPAIIMDAVIDPAGRIVAADFDGNFLESSDGAVWQVTAGSPDPMIALTRLPDGSIIAVGNRGQILETRFA